MSYSNYNTYNQFKGFQQKLRGVYVCRSGDSMTGNLNMTCNNVLNVKNLSFCPDGKIIGDVEVVGDLDVFGNVNLNCNLINDVSGINFCDGTYIGQGNSFDISANDVLVLSGVQDPSGAYNGASIVTKNRIFQQLNPDASWNAVNGYYGLAKDSYPALSEATAEKATSEWTRKNLITEIGTNINFTDCIWANELGLFIVINNNSLSGSRVSISPDGLNWTKITTPKNADWRSVVWAPTAPNGSGGKGLLVATALSKETGDPSDNVVMTSPDAINWTARNVPNNNNNRWNKVTWSPELEIFCATSIKSGGTEVMTSPDGINWTVHDTLIPIYANGLCWSPELGLFVAVGINTFKSPDGINWTQTATTSGYFWGDVNWSPELGIFVAVGDFGINRVMTSTDGINWEIGVSPIAGWRGIIWSKQLKLWIACANSPQLTNEPRIMTSHDGYNWNTRFLSLSNLGYNYNSVCFSEELSLIIAVGGFSYYIYSSLNSRIPTSYNVFDSSFNNIDNNGNWTIKAKEIYGDNLLLDSNVDITGNLIVRGTTTNVSTQDLVVKDNLIIINQTMDASGNVDPSGVLPDPTDFESGFVVYRGPENVGDPVREPYQFLYDESSNTFRIGQESQMQPVATREDNPTDNGVAVWDASDNRFVTDRGFVIDGSGNVEISGNLDLSCNNIVDVSSITFCGDVALSQQFDTSKNSIKVGYNVGTFDISGLGLDLSYNWQGYDVYTDASGKEFIFEDVFNSITIGRDAGISQSKQRFPNPSFPVSLTDAGGIAIGLEAGNLLQKDGGIAIGQGAGKEKQGYKAVALGHQAGRIDQAERGIALGSQAGQFRQGFFGIALGVDCGRFDQSGNAISIGANSGRNSQGGYAIAIGSQAGRLNQGENAIAIGFNAGKTNQNQNSIILNATGSVLNSDISDAFYVAPIRNDEGTALLQYNTTNKEITYSNTIIGDVEISGNLSMNDNLINDVSGINFSDGTYIGHGNSFDISTNEELKINSNGNILFNNQHLFINSTTGYVGIGTTDPSNILDINGGTIIRGRLNMEDKTTGDLYTPLYNQSGFTIIRSAPSTNKINLRSSDLIHLFATFDVSNTEFNSENITLNGNVDIFGNLSLNCNLLNDVSAINFNCGDIILTTTDNDNSLNSIKLGYDAGIEPSGNIINSICIGRDAGKNQTKPPPNIFQFDPAGIAIGTLAGNTGQIDGAIAIGSYAGRDNQGYKAVALGHHSGLINQGERAIALGSQAGQINQGSFSIALGVDCGRFDSSINAISIGQNSGRNSQGFNSIAIGSDAGRTVQGDYSVAIGRNAGRNNQHNNSIVISALGDLSLEGTPLVPVLDTDNSNAFYVAPIRNNTFSNTLGYNTTTKEIVYSAKSFIINHPTNENKYLVHGCLEGPEGGVYYRGKGEIVNNECVEIELPDYVCSFASEFTVQLTPIYSGKAIKQLYTTEVENNRFKVYGENCKFYWLVQGKRCDVEVEPYKSSVEVKGSGPYKWI